MVKILAVDDSRSMRHMVEQTLTEAGFETRLACDGVEALDVAGQYIADVVITDVNMPRMDGITLVKKLRELPSYRYKPILVLTTESSTEKKWKARPRAPAAGLLNPLTPSA